ncbi:MAG TPA: ATP-binding cassette domain-containing protein [Patescibacteria group bacterium]|nr:ATP-binding cassette domain-containing protein [Patescibacteria group bacterium]
MILEVKDVSKVFTVERGFFKQKAQAVRALDAVSFRLEQFRTLGIVGESGSGKTTLAKIILRLVSPTQGAVAFDPARITDFRKDVQIIFQNPYNSLNAKMRILDIIAEPLRIHRLVPRKGLKEKVAALLSMVGLDRASMARYPAEFSGGQRQRICIARALATQPKFIVLDEPISSLDLTIQAQMLDLFMRLKEECRLTYIFISHNLAVVKHIADSVIVMRDGRIVEACDTQAIFTSPQNDYTRLLLEAARG